MKLSQPTIGQLFLGFLQIGITGFGGVLPIARRALVERRRWLSEEAFSQDLAIAQLLPGPNIVNLSVAIGLRFAGIPGAIASFTAILAMPLVILLSLLAIYAKNTDVPQMTAALHGIAAVAAGLVGAMAWRMAQPLIKGDAMKWGPNIGLVLTSVVGIAVLGWHLLPTLSICGGLGILLAFRHRG
jgi:chromate transporter